MQGSSVLERIHALIAIAMVVSLIATPTLTLAQDAGVITSESTPVAPVEPEETPEAPDAPEVPSDEEGDSPVSEETVVPSEEVDDTTGVVPSSDASTSSEAPVAQAQVAETSAITFAMTSADPTVANRVSDVANWNVETVSNGATRYFTTVANNRTMPVQFTSPWLANVPYGDAVIKIDAGPEFELWSQTVHVNTPSILLDVVLVPVQEVQAGVLYFSVVSADPAALNRVPAGTSFRVYNAANQQVLSCAGIPQVLPTVTQVPARTNPALPLGDYRVVVTPPAGIGFLPNRPFQPHLPRAKLPKLLLLPLTFDDGDGLNVSAQVAGQRPNNSLITASRRMKPCKYTPYTNFELSASATNPVATVEVGDEIEFELVIKNTGDTNFTDQM